MSVYSARYVWVMVNDMERAREFYLDTLKLPRVQVNAKLEKRYLICQLDPILLVIAQAASNEMDRVGRWTGLSINVQDIEATANQLTSLGVTFIQEPVKQLWGGWQATIDDGCGNQLMLTAAHG